MRDDRLRAVDHLDGQLAIRREHPRQRPVHDALRVDGVGQHAPQLTRLGRCAVWPTDRTSERVMDVEADLAIGKDAVADAVELVSDDPVGRARDGAVPLEVDGLMPMAGTEPHPAPVVPGLDDQVGDDGRDGVPGRVTHRDVHPLDQLHATDRHVSQVGPVQRQFQGTRPERDRRPAAARRDP